MAVEKVEPVVAKAGLAAAVRRAQAAVEKVRGIRLICQAPQATDPGMAAAMRLPRRRDRLRRALLSL